MKKLLIGTAAVALGLAFAAPAQAEGVKLNLGGHFKGYGAWVDQDEPGATEVSEMDILRETEIHFTGETTLDNGLTVGASIEADIDNDTDTFENEESYVYFSGAWGRVNFGKEDGAAYLLQVAAPSADSNVDGLRQEIDPVNSTVLGIAGGESLDYDQDVTGYDNKVTYITPVFSGFQAAVSYTPDVEAAGSNDLAVGTDDVDNALGDTYDVAVRYEGQLSEVGVAVGAGYTLATLEAEDAAPAGTDLTDDREVWNVGADLDWGPFGFGAVYKIDNFGDTVTGDDEELIVVGLDYTSGPYKLGASYLNGENVTGVADLEADRYTGGLIYTYGPGMTFRGSVSYVEYDTAAGADVDATSVLVGTQINF